MSIRDDVYSTVHFGCPSSIHPYFSFLWLSIRCDVYSCIYSFGWDLSILVVVTTRKLQDVIYDWIYGWIGMACHVMLWLWLVVDWLGLNGMPCHVVVGCGVFSLKSCAFEVMIRTLYTVCCRRLSWVQRPQASELDTELMGELSKTVGNCPFL